jgi:hypothetical protein
MRWTVAVAVLCSTWASTALAGRVQQQIDYRDPQGRFTFSYPASWGETSVGTDNGFGNRVAALRFSVFTIPGVGGEAVLGQGPPSLDVQAAGGLYDDIVSGTLPAPALKAIAGVLPRLSAANVCDQLGREQHVDAAAPAFSLPEKFRIGIGMLDRLGNVAPTVRRCVADGEIVTFDKEASVSAGGARRRTYGAIKFLTGRYSMFAIVRAAGNPSSALLAEIRNAVASFSAR